jgi:serine/threonine-protein kinase
MTYRFQALGPLLAGEGSRAFLGLAISPDSRARPVVIIWVPEGAERDSSLLEKIRRETEHAAKLDHPNIVTVMGFAHLDEGHARVVEFADGESLRKLLETAKRLPVRIAAKIVCDACTGVHYAHVAGNDDGTPLVHGDLRPETILISFNGTTKVTGYGALAFAPPQAAEGQKVKSGRRVQTAPEQIIGGRAAMSLPTDVYLLGLMLYECLTGAAPWAEQGDFFDHAVLSLPLPPATPGYIPEKLEAIIQQACAKKAADRFPTPLALREAIEHLLGNEIASTEELARYLESLFPQSNQLRADRRRTIDAGIADFVRRQWADQAQPIPVPAAAPPKAQPVASQPPPPPAVTPVAGRPLPPPPAHPQMTLPVGRPVPPDKIIEPDEDEEEKPDAPEPEPEGSAAPWLILLAVFVAVIAGWWAWNKANAPIPGVDQMPVVAEVDAGPAAVKGPAVVEAVDAAVAEPADAAVTGATPDAGAAAVPAPAPPADPGVPDSGPRSAAVTVDAGLPTAAVEAEVTVESTPPLDVLYDGKLLGHTPWSGKLPTGRRSITLQARELNISAVRTITVGGESSNFKFTFEKGSVAVVAPDGAAIVIDGVRVGTAPLTAELSVYEGFHRISVTVGQSKWNDTFTLYPGQRVNFNVELQ